MGGGIRNWGGGGWEEKCKAWMEDERQGGGMKTGVEGGRGGRDENLSGGRKRGEG
jgi:hypothetical protein